jgi:hypothetical protein
MGEVNLKLKTKIESYNNTLDELWDYYSGLPNPMSYQSEVETKDNLGCLYPDCICQGNEITNCQNRI